MAATTEGYIRAGTVEDFKARGCAAVTGGGHTIAVFCQSGQFYAVDNRCPHMGFPLLVLFVLIATVAFTSTKPAATPPAAIPSLKIVAPAIGATVTGPKGKVEVDAKNWKTVAPAGSPVTPGERHLHFFIDVPASSVAVGQAIPTGDPKYVHAGGALLTDRELELSPGQHTITVVAANAAHIALASPTPQSVTFTVK